MKKNLKRQQILFYLDGFGVVHAGANPAMLGDCSGLSGNCTGLSGNCTGLSGNCTGLWGNCTGLWGNCTGLIGDLDECEISDDDRKNGIKIIDLVG